MATAPAHQRTRHVVLIFGPFAIIGCCFWLTRPPLSLSRDIGMAKPSVDCGSIASFIRWWQPVSSLFNRDHKAEKLDNESPPQEEITKNVQEAANQLRMELGTDFQILARAPLSWRAMVPWKICSGSMQMSCSPANTPFPSAILTHQLTNPSKSFL